MSYNRNNSYYNSRYGSAPPKKYSGSHGGGDREGRDNDSSGSSGYSRRAGNERDRERDGRERERDYYGSYRSGHASNNRYDNKYNKYMPQSGSGSIPGRDRDIRDRDMVRDRDRDIRDRDVRDRDVRDRDIRDRDGRDRDRGQYSTTTKNGGSIYYGTAASSSSNVPSASSSSSFGNSNNGPPYKKRPGVDRYESYPKYRTVNGPEDRSLHKSHSSSNIGKEYPERRQGSSDYSKDRRGNGSQSNSGSFRDDRRHTTKPDKITTTYDRRYDSSSSSPVSRRNSDQRYDEKRNSPQNEKRIVSGSAKPIKDSSSITDPKLLHLFDDDYKEVEKKDDAEEKEDKIFEDGKIEEPQKDDVNNNGLVIQEDKNDLTEIIEQEPDNETEIREEQKEEPLTSTTEDAVGIPQNSEDKYNDSKEVEETPVDLDSKKDSITQDPISQETPDVRKDVEDIDLAPAKVADDDLKSKKNDESTSGSDDTVSTPPKKTSFADYLVSAKNKTKSASVDSTVEQEPEAETYPTPEESKKSEVPDSDEKEDVTLSGETEENQEIKDEVKPIVSESHSNIDEHNEKLGNDVKGNNEIGGLSNVDSISDTQTSAGDTSLLSPIKETVLDPDFNFNSLASIPEAKEKILESEDENMNEKSQSEEEITNAEGLSEAETVVAESPPRINKGRRLVRKAEFDEVRHNLKRKALYSSEDDDDDDDDDDDFRSTKRPHVGDLGRSGRSSSIQKPYKLKRDAGGRSMLQRSCKKGNLNEVQSYIARGANANEKDFCGFTCLHEAALEGHTEVVRFLIEHGANVNAKADAAGDSETPLIDAAENKHYEVVKLLLDNGADPSIYNIDGFTALTKIQNEHTDEEGYDKIIRLLEEASAKFKLATKVEVAKATSPSPSPSPIVEDPNDNYFGELIKKKGIFKYAAEGSKEVTANYFVSGNSLSAKPDILILAARNGHAELVDIILGLNPTPYNIDNEGGCGVTALLASVGRGHYEVVENLLSKDADPFKKRKQDGLNALEIAQRSIHFDPREIKLIHEYMNKKAPSKLGQMSTAVSTVVSVVPSPVRSAVASSVASANVSEAVSEDGSDADDDEEEDARDINRTKSNEERKRKSGIDKDQLVKRLKKTKSESKIKIQPSSVFKESSPEPLDRIERITTREQSSSPPPDRARNKSVYSTVSPSPTPSTKAQEELKAKNALEAKMWQEKAEAKKRARRDMFLKAEKEKERQRKEDEEKRVIEEKKAAEFKEEERLRLAKEAEAKTKVLKEQRVALMREFTIENYPIGLRTAKFNVTLTADDIRRYAPLYIFNIDGVKYVTDLQIALLTGAKVSSFISTFGPEVKSEATQVDKSKIWRLFYEIIGIDPSNSTVNTQSRVEGHGQFQNLVIHFIRFDDISKFVKLQYPVTYNFVWDQLSKYSTEVLLESLLPFDDQQRNCVVDESSMEIVVDTKSIGKFIPPHLGYRKDIIRTISSNSRPLW